MGTWATSSRTAELGGLGERKLAAQETEQDDGQRHEDTPRGGQGPESKGRVRRVGQPSGVSAKQT